MKTLKNQNFKEKRVLLRCDFNVPLGSQGEILDDFRLKKSLPTINYLVETEAKVILMSHLGRPEGKKDLAFSLERIGKRLSELSGREVIFIEDCIGKEIEEKTLGMKEGEILLLENLRFHKEEEENDEGFAKELALLGDVFVNDAFSVCHRENASVSAITKFLPSFAGLLLEEETRVLSDLKNNPAKPLVAVIGGIKMETKVRLIDEISKVADFILISNLFKREVDEKNIVFKHPEKIVAAIDELEGGKDIGPKTIEIFKEKISSAKTVFWNGPLGQIEKEEFSLGSKEVAKAIVESPAFSVAGGGETIEFLNKIGLLDKFGYVSTGGGAMLSFLVGEKMPGIEVLG